MGILEHGPPALPPLRRQQPEDLRLHRSATDLRRRDPAAGDEARADLALAQVTTHDLVFRRWGLAERHPGGTALAFNFAGPSGTGKTICAEAIAHALGRRLMVVRYAELESVWMGETPKNVSAI